MKETAWSLSRLQSSETCLKKFAAETIEKTVKPVSSFASEEGKRKHDMLQKYVEKRGHLPSDLTKFKPAIDHLIGMGRCVAERAICIDNQMQEVPYYSKQAWCRGKIDLQVQYAPHASLVVDWKFGRPSDSTDQLDLMATLLFTIDDSLQEIVGMYYWFRDGFHSNPCLYTRKDLPNLWAGYHLRVKKYQEAINSRQFPPSPSGLCKAHCNVTGCPYYGKGPM